MLEVIGWQRLVVIHLLTWITGLFTKHIQNEIVFFVRFRLINYFLINSSYELNVGKIREIAGEMFDALNFYEY